MVIFLICSSILDNSGTVNFAAGIIYFYGTYYPSTFTVSGGAYLYLYKAPVSSSLAMKIAGSIYIYTNLALSSLSFTNYTSSTMHLNNATISVANSFTIDAAAYVTITYAYPTLVSLDFIILFSP